jgi:hypothetical protein
VGHERRWPVKCRTGARAVKNSRDVGLRDGGKIAGRMLRRLARRARGNPSEGREKAVHNVFVDERRIGGRGWRLGPSPQGHESWIPHRSGSRQTLGRPFKRLDVYVRSHGIAALRRSDSTAALVRALGLVGPLGLVLARPLRVAAGLSVAWGALLHLRVCVME